MLLFKLFSRKSTLALPEADDAPEPVAPVLDGEGFNALKPCRHGLMVFNRNDQYIGRSLALYSEFSEHEVLIFRHFLAEGGTVVEVGANIGAHTVYFSSAVGPGGSVLAFEPQRLVFQTLCANLAINSIANVHAYHAAVGRTPGSIVVPELDPNTFQNFGGLSIQGYDIGSEVPMVTIDNLGLARCDLIKIDVEGMEEEVLAGATETIRKLRPVLYVENDRRDKSASLIRFIQGLGYRLWWHLPPLYNPDNLAGNPEDVFSNLVSCNVLCIPAEREVDLPGDMEVQGPDDWRLAS